jgi:hypothetical protein
MHRTERTKNWKGDDENGDVNIETGSLSLGL